MGVCQSYEAAQMVCRDGFVQRSYCRGHGGCVSCGNIPDKALPNCLRDEIPAHLATDAGAPLLYRNPKP